MPLPSGGLTSQIPHFGAHTESEESSSLPVAKQFLRLCLAKILLQCVFLDLRDIFGGVVPLRFNPFSAKPIFGRKK